MMKITLALFAILAIIGLGQSHQFPNFGHGPLYEDIQDILDLVPMRKIIKVVSYYAKHDREVQDAIKFLSTTPTFKNLLIDFESIPEVINFFNYLYYEGIEIYYLVNQVNRALEIKELIPPGTPTPSEPTPTPSESTPTPSEPTPTPSEPTPTPSEPTPTPSESTPTPSEPTPTPSESTPTPSEPSSSPVPTSVSTAGPTSSPVPTSASTAGPTSSPVPTSVSTAEPTSSPVPTSASTAGPTSSPVPTSVSTAGPTSSPVPTSASTAGPTSSPVPTSVSTAGPTSSPVPTSASTAGPTSSPVPTSTSKHFYYNTYNGIKVRTRGLAGLFKDIKRLFNYDDFISVYVDKLKHSSAFGGLVHEIKSENFQLIVNKLFESQSFQTIHSNLNFKVNLKIVGDIFYLVFGVSVPDHVKSLDEHFVDFFKLLPGQEIADVLVKYLNEDEEVYNAILFMISSEFHDLLRAVEALKEHQAFVVYLQKHGINIIQQLQEFHKAIGMEDYVPPKIENYLKAHIKTQEVGDGIKGLIADLYSLLPLAEIDALFQEKLRTSKIFSDFYATITSPEFENLHNNLAVQEPVKQLVTKSNEKGLDLVAFQQFGARMIGLKLGNKF